MNAAEFKRWLAKQGCTFEPGKGSHLKVQFGRRMAVVEAILKQLGMKPGGLS